MVTWLISLLGLGGIGAALFFIPGAIPAVVGALSALLSLIRRNPWQCALIAGLLVCGRLWHGKAKAIDQRDAAIAQKAAQIAEYRRVYNETFAAHWKAKLAEDARRTKITQEADDATTPRRTTALAGAAAYADRWQVCRPAADSSVAQGGDLPRPAPAAGSPEASTPVAGMVAVSRPSFDACTLNSADLGIAYEWAQKVIAAKP